MSALRMKEGPLAGQRIVVDEQVVLGRHGADVTIDDPQISRRHAIVRSVEGTLEIEDLGSLNGTWVNGDRLTAVRRLSSGDEIRLGATTIEVELDPRPTGPALTVAAPAAGRVAAPAPRAEHPDDALRPVTALFADIVGSTGLGERLSPDEVKAVVGECVTRMARIVERFGGTVQAYMGDGIAAFFGLPMAHEDDPERASRAALRIIEDVEAYAVEVERAWGIADFSARVGLNTGEVAVGPIGGADPQSVSLGDTANVAARLQGLAQPGTIAVGDSTARRVLHAFALEPLGGREVKGRVQPVEMWRLVCAQAATQTGGLTPLVGRDQELERLRTVLDELAAGRGRIVLVLGEAGIGKTRLLTEARTIAADRVTWLEGQCRSYGTDLIYGPFVQMLRRWIGVEEGEAPLSVRTKLRAKLALLADAPPALLPAFSRLLSLPSVGGESVARRPQSLAVDVREAVRAWIVCLARQSPVVIAIEDVHWADPSTLLIANDLVDIADTQPILLVASSRIDPDSEGWALRVRVLAEYAHRAVELQLEPLSDEAARQLLAGLARSGELTAEQREHVVRAAEGNPLYLEELVDATATGSGAAPAEEALTAVGAASLTPTLESLLLARTDRLTPAARRLAVDAAVVGRSFPLRVLEHVAGDAGLEQSLAELLRADVVRELRRYPEPEYVFRHGLLREALLATLPPARRRELYTTVGLAVEVLFADSLDEYLELLAHYFARSDDRARALAYLERSALRAAGLGAGDRADQYWRRALVVAEALGDADAADRLRGRIAGEGG